MKPHYTSVPEWARRPRIESADRSGRSHTVLAIGTGEPAHVADSWVADLADTGAAIRRHDCTDIDAARRALSDDLRTARVGHRVAVAGSVRDCLALRAHAIAAGLADDELRVGVVSVADRSVWCVHCRTVTAAAVEIDATVACAGCGRRLVVYPHISRRLGHHLGFMVDAEDQPFEPPIEQPGVRT